MDNEIRQAERDQDAGRVAVLMRRAGWVTHGSGFRFRLPAGWRSARTDEGVFLIPADPALDDEGQVLELIYLGLDVPGGEPDDVFMFWPEATPSVRHCNRGFGQTQLRWPESVRFPLDDDDDDDGERVVDVMYDDLLDGELPSGTYDPRETWTEHLEPEEASNLTPVSPLPLRFGLLLVGEDRGDVRVLINYQSEFSLGWRHEEAVADLLESVELLSERDGSVLGRWRSVGALYPVLELKDDGTAEGERTTPPDVDWLGPTQTLEGARWSTRDGQLYLRTEGLNASFAYRCDGDALVLDGDRYLREV